MTVSTVSTAEPGTLPGSLLLGDSRGLHRVAEDLARGTRVARSLRDTLANRELAQALSSWNSAPEHPDAFVAALFPEPPPASNVPFLPKERLLSPREKSAAADAFAQVLESCEFTSGPAVTAFEDALADYAGLSCAVATGSGTDALAIALRAVGVEPGDEVILPANSFAATENAVFACGAVPVLADVTTPDGNLDPESVAERITPRTVALLPVHLYGKLADMAGLRAVADRHGLRIVEDACQAIGVTGVGRYSDAAALSFNPYKNVGLCGKAGAVVTGSAEIAERCRVLGYHGFEPGRKNVKREAYGLNARIDNTMAAIGLALLPWTSLRGLRRTYLARRYVEALRPLAAEGVIETPVFAPDHSWHLFPVLAAGGAGARDALLERLARTSRVETDVYYPVLTHRQKTPVRERFFGQAHLPRTEWLHGRVLHLPLHAGLSLGEQDRVVEALYAATRRAAA
ncbi:DegT/DnrJ/EryC1/StrS family aminotransferase [Streptomyces sp. NPDC056039]|uniref:DegT/DnrJ/EryC1/StrS family aminotransferase n=1 Tax=Streptomyces sp. NPDC056039 TaxID=3345687 RepID=UPI0035DBAF79